MANPWLSIPLQDYEGHMGRDNAQQLSVLSELFKRALDICTPDSVAVLGIAGGNGLEHLDHCSALQLRRVRTEIRAEQTRACEARAHRAWGRYIAPRTDPAIISSIETRYR